MRLISVSSYLKNRKAFCMRIIKNIFIKTVLCGLAEKGHQVIYTTHSDKMLDIFDTRGLIRFEFDEESKQTVLKYNKHNSEFLKVEEDEKFLMSCFRKKSFFLKLMITIITSN